MVLRSLSFDEKRLIYYLLENSGESKFTDLNVDSIKVKVIDDGEMGSLQLCPPIVFGGPVFGRVLSDCCFDDEDGVKVIATLNLDKDDNLFELDIWKTNFGKLIRIPELFYQK